MAAVTYDYNAQTKTIVNATAATYSFGASEIAGDGVAAYTLSLTGTNDDYGSISRTRVKAGGQLLVDVASAHLTAFIQRMSTSKWAMAATDTAYTVALYTLDAKGLNERYACGFPIGQSPTVEVVVDGTGAAGTLQCGWRLYEGTPAFYPLLLGSQMQIAASATNARYSLTQGGLLRGFSISTTSLDRLRLVINGKQLFNLSGAQLQQCQAMEGQDGGSTNELFFKIAQMLPITAGNSFVEIDTAAGWGGVTEEITIYSYVPQVTNAG